MPWAIENTVVALLAAMGILTTTLSIIEPRPLLAISQQAHAVFDPIWYSSKSRMNVPLGLSDHEDFPLYGNNTSGDFHPLYGSKSSYTYITAKSSSSPVTSTSSKHTTELFLVPGQSDANARDLPVSGAPREPPVDDRKSVLRYLLHAWDWICRYQVTLVVVFSLAALGFVFFVPITVPTNLPGMPRVKATRRAAKGSCGNQCSLFDTVADSLFDTLPLSKSLDESAQRLDNSFHGCYVKRSRFNRKQRAFHQKKLALAREKSELSSTKWDLEVQKFMSHARNIVTEGKLVAAQQEAAVARSESQKLQYQQMFLTLESFVANTQVELSARDEEHYQSQWILNVSLYFQSTSLQKQLEASETSKKDLQAEVEPLRENNAKLQKEVANSEYHNAKMHAKSSEHGRKMKALEGQVEAKNKEAGWLTTTLAKLTGDLSVQEKKLKSKTEESSDIEKKATALFESGRAFKRDLEETKVQLNTKVELLKGTRLNFAELKQREATTNNESKAAKKQMAVLNASLATENDKLRKSEAKVQKQQEAVTGLWEEMSTLQQTKEALETDVLKLKDIRRVSHEKKLDLEKQLATLQNHKGEVVKRLEAASKDASEVKQKLLLAHEENKDMVSQLKTRDERLKLAEDEITRSHAEHQTEIDMWTAMRDSLLTQADQSMRLRKAAQAEAAESNRALLQHQAARANAFTTMAMMAKKRRESGRSKSSTSSESSPPTSPDTQFEGSRSSLKPSLNASAIEFKPRNIPSPKSSQDSLVSNTAPDHEHHFRKGRLARQLRRPSNASRVAKTQMQVMMHISPTIQIQVQIHISVTLPSIQLRLPFGGSFSRAGSLLALTVWRYNNTALIVAQHSSNPLQSSFVHFCCDMLYIRSRTSARHVLRLFHQSAQLLINNGGRMSPRPSTLVKGVLRAIIQAKNRSAPLPSIMPAKSSFSKAPSPTSKEDLIQPANGVARDAPRPTAEAQPVNEVVSSRWAQRAHKHDKRSSIPCRFFAKGYCKKGVACEYKHDSNAPPQAPTSAPLSTPGTSAGPAVSSSAPEPTNEKREMEQSADVKKQVEKRAEDIKAANWKMSYKEAELQAENELGLAAEAAKAEANRQAENKAKKAAEDAEALTEEIFQQKVEAHSTKVQARGAAIKAGGPWNMSLADGWKLAEEELKGEAPTR